MPHLQTAPRDGAKRTQLQCRITAYSAAVAAVCVSSSSQAQVFSQDFSSNPLQVPGHGNLFMDFDLDGAVDAWIKGRLYNHAFQHLVVNGNFGGWLLKGIVGAETGPERLAAGFGISAGSPFLGGSGGHRLAYLYGHLPDTGFGAFLEPEGAEGLRGYIGVKFETPAGDRFGWIDYQANLQANGGQVFGFAYESSGASLLAGEIGTPIPEPADTAFGLGLLALGAAGVREYRKRRSIARFPTRQ